MTDLSALYVIVHPFSNTDSQLTALRSEDYSKFKGRVREYLERITAFISTTSNPMIITQAHWCIEDLLEKLGRLKPKSLSGLISTYGDAGEGDSPFPLKGWDELKEAIGRNNPEEVIVSGSQLAVQPILGFFHNYSRCVGGTYRELKSSLSCDVRLERELCLEYPI